MSILEKSKINNLSFYLSKLVKEEKKSRGKRNNKSKQKSMTLKKGEKNREKQQNQKLFL